MKQLGKYFKVVEVNFHQLCITADAQTSWWLTYCYLLPQSLYYTNVDVFLIFTDQACTDIKILFIALPWSLTDSLFRRFLFSVILFTGYFHLQVVNLFSILSLTFLTNSSINFLSFHVHPPKDLSSCFYCL
jgi:hypothetical protein